MSNTFTIIGDAMRAEADVLRIVSVNVANAETTAYRRQVPLTHAVQGQFEQLLGSAAAQVPGQDLQQAAALSAPPMRSALDLRPGTLKSTTEPLHIALDGPGFFALQPASISADEPRAHELLLTRRGDLHVTVDGYLAGATGALVLGAKGPVHVGTAMPAIAADGSVQVNGQLVDQLRVVNVLDATRMQSLGDGTYRVEANAVAEGEHAASVRQGFLESSNVTPVNEILQLMETVRRFEAEQKFARAYDGMLEKAISELGKTG